MRRTDLPSALVLYAGVREKSWAKLSAAEHGWFFDLVQGGVTSSFLNCFGLAYMTQRIGSPSSRSGLSQVSRAGVYTSASRR
jgi:hypothetical protein